MSRRVPFLAIGLLFAAMLMPSNPSNPLLLYEKVHDRISYEIQMRKPFETLPWSYQTHLATDTWDVRPGDGTSSNVMSSKRQERVREIIHSKKYETVACIGEITGVDLENAKTEFSPSHYSYERQIIAHFRTLKVLSGDCPDILSIYSRSASSMRGDGFCGTSIPDPSGQSHFVCGDRLLVLAVKEPSLQSQFWPVWGVLAYWYLKNSSYDRAQYIYGDESFYFDDKAMARIPRGYTGHLSAFCWRKFVTRGETLQQGVDVIQGLYSSASPAVTPR